MTTIFFNSYASGVVVEAAYLASGENTADTDVYSFLSQSLGTADPDRYIICCINHADLSQGTPTLVSSVVIAGVTATEVIQVSSNAGGGQQGSAIYIAAVPTGTSGTITVTLDDSSGRCAISNYRAILISPTANDTATDTGTALDQTLSVPSSGFLIATCGSASGSTATCTWTGVTENVDATVDTASNYSAGLYTATTAVSRQVIAALSGDPTPATFAAASWG